MSRLGVALVVQGEGRGHMTQALALARFLRDAGHEISTAFVGVSPHRPLPSYFVEGMPAPVVTFSAPTQVPGPDGRALSVGRTTADALARLPRFIRSGVSIHRQTAAADVVVNLLDFVTGASRALLRTRTPAVSVGHNYLFAHAELSGAPTSHVGRRLLGLYTAVTALGSAARVALSFAPVSTPSPRRRDLLVAPPLLRPGLERLEPSDDGYLLAYALNRGYARRLAEWQARSDGVAVHCYVEGGAAALGGAAPGFHAHDLDQEAFLEHLRGCRAYVGSAGFESLCEAFYLGKPVLAVPTGGHVEQRLNAWDAERHGVARQGSYDDMDRFWADPPEPDPASVGSFRAWVARAPEILVGIVEGVASGSLAA